MAMRTLVVTDVASSICLNGGDVRAVFAFAFAFSFAFKVVMFCYGCITVDFVVGTVTQYLGAVVIALRAATVHFKPHFTAYALPKSESFN